jgi:hypothetical protein
MNPNVRLNLQIVARNEYLISRLEIYSRNDIIKLNDYDAVTPVGALADVPGFDPFAGLSARPGRVL